MLFDYAVVVGRWASESSLPGGGRFRGVASFCSRRVLMTPEVQKQASRGRQKTTHPTSEIENTLIVHNGLELPAGGCSESAKIFSNLLGNYHQ
jgi:hypothetical protein